MRCAIALLLVLVRAQPAVEQDLRQPAGDPQPIWRRSPPTTGSAATSSRAAASRPYAGRTRRSRWTLETDDGVTHEFDVVVTAVGMLDVPNVPDIAGADRFRGRRFHSSQWDHSKSTAGERVASIGTGASAIQYVPEIAQDAAHLTVFQRTPIWVSPGMTSRSPPSSRNSSNAIPTRHSRCETRHFRPTSRPTSPHRQR